MHAGKLRHRLTFQSPNTVSGTTYRDPQDPWANAAGLPTGIPCEIIPLTGRELFQAREVHATVDHRVILRFVSGVRSEWRLLYGARKFTIDAVINEGERNLWLRLLCTEVNDGA